jgi:uncharacterized protein (TIGR03083 family)
VAERLAARDVYRWHVERLRVLAGELSDAQLKTTVPACPAWTVRDVYGHLAGVGADIVTPGLTPSLEPAHTQHHVDARADRTLDAVCQELEANQDGVGDFLDQGIMAAPALDIWAHYNDIRGALALPRPDDDGDVLAFAVALLAAGQRRSWAGSDRPTLRVVGDRREWVFGEGEPEATLTGDDYELARQFMGRRSRAQLLSMDWTGDPTPYVEDLSVFPPPVADLLD